MTEHLYTVVANEVTAQLAAHLDSGTNPERELVVAARDLLECRRVYVPLEIASAAAA